MSDSITLEDFYKLFQHFQAETDRRAAETDRLAAENDRRATENERRAAENERRAAENDRRIAENERRAAENDRRIAENERRAAENDRRADQFNRELAESHAKFQQELAASRAETDRRHQELREIVAKTNKQVGGISNRWGELVEGLVRPAAVNLLRERGIQVHHTVTNLVLEDGSMEVDLLAENTVEVVAIEVKANLKGRDLKRFLKNLQKFKTVFPKYQSYRLYGAVAGIRIDPDLEQKAIDAGLWVMKPSGETMSITNKPEFEPSLW